MTQSDILILARAGAQARLNEIDVERRRLLRYFPGLAVVSPAVSRPQRVVSAAARRAVSVAQKKRWAEWKAKRARTDGAGHAAKGRSRKKK
jgi:hypothetical protein